MAKVKALSFISATIQKLIWAHHAKTDLNKKSGAMQQTLTNFNIDAQGFRKTNNENPPTREMGVTS